MDHFEVKNDEITSTVRGIGDCIHAALNDNTEHAGKLGFCLLIFEFGENGAVFYMSDAQRDAMLRVLEEFIARQRKETT